jgi:hypothetical protein
MQTGELTDEADILLLPMEEALVLLILHRGKLRVDTVNDSG